MPGRQIDTRQEAREIYRQIAIISSLMIERIDIILSELNEIDHRYNHYVNYIEDSLKAE